MSEVAKHDWKQLEKEYVLSEYKSIKEFLQSKDIRYNGNAREKTKGWTKKRVTKQEQKSNKIIEKVIEKESEKEAQQIVDLKSIANDLALKVIEAQKELNMHLAKNTTKTKKVKYDYECKKPKEEIIEEKEKIVSYIDIIDRKGLKELTSALKDLNDIINNKQNENNETQSLAEAIQKAYESKVGGN